jgi:molybdopterin-guanine dinucleotide biosynthesis protein A
MKQAITGIILAGGQGRRMGGADKGLVPIAGRTMIEHVIDRLRPQVTHIVISANRSLPRYAQFGFPVVIDASPDYPGPLAGIAAGMQSATTDYVAVVPCDCPLIDEKLVERLARAYAGERADIAVAHDGQRLQPAFLFLRREMLSDLTRFLDDGGRKIEAWLQRHRTAVVPFDHKRAFVNLNDTAECGLFEASR